MTARSWYSITNRAAGEAEVFVYDEIGAHGITAKAFVAALTPLASKPIRLRVNSPGGSVFDAVAIYNALKGHRHKVTAVVEGLAASAASVIIMAAAEIRAAGNSFLMMHNPHGICLGDAEDMRKMGDLLDRVRVPLVAAYRRSGKTDAEIEALMDAESWYSADEAKQHGFVDYVDQPIQIAAHFDLSKFNYRHAPQPSPADAWGKVINAKFSKP